VVQHAALTTPWVDADKIGERLVVQKKITRRAGASDS
jgi:hypothetical protein